MADDPGGTGWVGHDPFEQWLDAQVRHRDGTLDLAQLHGMAQRFGVVGCRRYAHLRPDEQRGIIGALLHDRVPTHLYKSPSAAEIGPTAPGRPPGSEPPGAAPRARAGPGRPALVAGATVAELLALFGHVMDELKARDVIRSSNAPGGDYAEFLCARAFGWRLLGRSAREVDAVDAGGRRYQIKSRRLTGANGERQLSALRGLIDDPFDTLAGVLFGPDFSVAGAALVPHAVVVRRARFVPRTNSHTFVLDDAVWGLAGVRDVTAELAAAARRL